MNTNLDTDINCRYCGSEYELIEMEAHKETFGKEYCDICGQEVMAWQGDKCCTLHLVKRSKQ